MKLIFITGHRRSGSTLLGSLLDDNPRKLMKETLIPTVLGHKSLGNSYNIVISGISKKRKNNWKKSLTFEEINVIELFLQSYFNNFGYTLKNRKIDHEAITKYYNKVNSRFFFMDRFK